MRYVGEGWRHHTERGVVYGPSRPEFVCLGPSLERKLLTIAIVKQIHKTPQLDLVGWYTVLPKSGPTPSILPIHNYLLAEHNESSLLLGFHPEEAVDHSAGSKLPLTIYESNYEVDEPKGTDPGEDKEMRDGEPPLKLKFRELPYSVETGEAEMISMDFVARGAGNATRVEPRVPQQTSKDAKGKQREAAKSEEVTAHVLSRDDEEMIAALTAKANAVKMLQSRINLLTLYLERLPPSLSAGSSLGTDAQAPDGPHTTPSHTILRSIQALVNRLSLVVPSNTEAFEQEMLSEANDVHLMGLLNDVLQSMTDARGVGKKFSIVEGAKAQNRKLVDSSMAVDRGSFLPGTGDLNI